MAQNAGIPEKITHPQFGIIVEGIQQFHDVMVIAGGEDFYLHHVILQLLVSRRADDLGGSQDTRLFILGLEHRGGEKSVNAKTDNDGLT